MSQKRFTILILAIAAVAIVAVLSAGGGINLPSLGGGDDDDAQEQVADTGAPETDAEEPEEEEPELELPENPDEVRGTDSYALTRPANLRRALAVLDERRQDVEGVFDGLRIAPGRIDTVIIHPDDRRTNIQVRPDMEISFESTHDFPTQQGFRRGGLSAREVPVAAVDRLLRAIDRERSGSAARDVDYVVVGKDIIDFGVDVTAYMRIRTPRPRYWRLENGRAVSFG